MKSVVCLGLARSCRRQPNFLVCKEANANFGILLVVQFIREGVQFFEIKKNSIEGIILPKNDDFECYMKKYFSWKGKNCAIFEKYFFGVCYFGLNQGIFFL